MKWQVIKIRALRWVRRILLYGSYSIIVAALSGFLLLQIPAVQENLISRYMAKLARVSGFRVSFESMYLLWYDHLEIKGLVVKDPEDNTMIRVRDLSLNFRVSSLWNKSDINIDGVALDSAEVYLVNIQESDTSRNLNINVFINRINQMASSGEGGGKSPKINLGEVVLARSLFSYNDNDADSIRQGFDYRHFKLSVRDGELSNFKVIGDTIQFNVNSLAAMDERTQLDVKHLQTFFRISQTALEFLDLHLEAGQSKIADTVIFSYGSQRDFSNFNTRVSIKATLRNTYLHPADLALFAPEAGAINQSLTLSGKITGKVNRLKCSNMDLQIGRTWLSGRLEMDGLPTIHETFITANLKKSRVDVDDFRFLFSPAVFERLRPLDHFLLQGTFTGFINDFVANAAIDSPLGLIQSNINLKVNEKDIDQSLYHGNLELTDFDLGAYMEDTITFQHVSLQGNVNGRGLSYSSADFVLVGAIHAIGIMGYNYVKINTNARFASQFFEGTMRVDDPNLKFNAEGSIDFRKSRDLVKIKANLDTAMLHNLGFSKQKLFIRSYLDINTHGFKIDSLYGNALFKNTKIVYRENFVELDSIHLISEKKEDDRQITLRSSLVDASLKGNYYYSTLFSDLNNLFNEFLLSVQNDRVALAKYYDSKDKSSQEYEATISLQLHHFNPIAELAGIDLRISKNTLVEGRFSNGLTSILQAFSTVDSIEYDGALFTTNDIEFTASKIRDSANVLAMATIRSDLQQLTRSLSTKNLLIEGIWNRDHVALGLDVDQVGIENYVRLRSEIDFLRDSTKIKILPSLIQALNKKWEVDQQNYILFKGRELSTNHLEIRHEEESMMIDGIVSENPEASLVLSISNLNLDIFNAITTENFKGIMNGTVTGKNLLHLPYIQNNLEIRDLTINNFLIGNVFGANEWSPEKQKFDINFSIDRLSERTMSISGNYDPAIKENPLDIQAKFNNANLKIIEPVLRGLFSQIDGELSGVYLIRGTFSRPAIHGEGTIKDGQIMIDYLKTLYRFSGNLGMSPNQIIFNDIELSDALGNKGTLDGFIIHKNFSKFTINLDGSFTNLQVLNTTAKDNSLFYGQGYATGRLNIFGPSSNLKISATARTENNSKIYIPVSGTEEVAKKDFITFAHFTDSASRANPIKVKAQTELTGITMDLNVDITPAAYAEIIFDIKAGDIIRGRGNGDIKLQLDTKGEFNMFGGIEFTEGAYNFTLADIINKEFSVKPGSRITWYGDPYQGILDITASYRQLASLSPIFPDPVLAADPALRRRYPVEVQLKLDGAMLSPQINFDLAANDLPNNVVTENGTPVRLNFEFNAFKAKLDEQELKRQVFSLIVLRRLSPPDAFSTSGSLANSVSELLSNQLSYWITQVDQNLEIDMDLDLGSLDQEAFNTFQLRLSYSFLNGRLRITRDGTFTSQSQQQQSVASLAGDWTVDYLLTPDGKFKVKMYSRSNFNALSSSLGANTLTTGFSLLHTQNFNEVKDLLRFAHDKRRKEMTEENKNQLQQDGGNF